MKRLLSVLILVALVFTAASAQKKDKKDGDSGKSEENNPKLIEWMRYDDGLKLAKEKGQHVLVNFTTRWCGWCKKMNRTTFAEPEVVNMLDKYFVSIKVDGDSKKELDIEGYKITERDLAVSEYHVRGYPAYWFLKPNGDRLGVLPGYQQADIFLDVLYFMKERLYDKMTFEEYIKAGGRQGYSKG